MGWSGGSSIAEPVIKKIREQVPEGRIRRRIYRVLLDALTDADWDNVDEVLGLDPEFDIVAAEDGWGVQDDD